MIEQIGHNLAHITCIYAYMLVSSIRCLINAPNMNNIISPQICRAHIIYNTYWFNKWWRHCSYANSNARHYLIYKSTLLHYWIILNGIFIEQTNQNFNWIFFETTTHIKFLMIRLDKEFSNHFKLSINLLVIFVIFKSSIIHAVSSIKYVCLNSNEFLHRIYITAAN